MGYDYVIGAALGAAVAVFLFGFAIVVRSGNLAGAFEGMAIAGRSRRDAAFKAKLDAIMAGGEVKPTAPVAPPKPTAPPPPPKPSGAPLRMLALLQAEARLLDFLMEDISGAMDAQIGQAVREIHKKAQAAIKRHAVVEQVLPGNEGDNTTVPKGFDPSAIRVIGNVAGSPPFTGSINHPGWRVKELKLAPPPEGADEFVLQPAEVQIG